MKGVTQVSLVVGVGSMTQVGPVYRCGQCERCHSGKVCV